MKTILVMGGAGYIGSHTVKHLLKNGYQCVVADNLVYGHREAVPENAVFMQADLMDKESLKKISDDYSFYQDDIGLNRDVTTLLSSNNDIDITKRISIITQLPGMIKGFFDKFNDITIY